MGSLRKQLEKLVGEARVGPVHISMYVALLQCQEDQGGGEPVRLVREKVMELARIVGVRTYYKTLKELDDYGVIRYVPSRDRERRSEVWLGG